MSETKELSPVSEIRRSLDKMKDQFKVALPPHITAEKFCWVVMTAIQQKPALLESDRKSLFGEALKCAQDGLLPDGREATLSTFKGTVKYMPMIGGICKRARNSGEIATIDAQVVYENDTYDAWTDEKGQHFTHKRARTNRGKPILTYAYAITKDGAFYFEEIDETQMTAIENTSQASTGPWKGSFKDEMRRKSALRRMAKYRLPSSADLDTVIQRDDSLFDLEKPQAEPAEPESTGHAEPPKKPSRLKSIVKAAENKPEPVAAGVVDTTAEPTEDPF